MARLSIPSQPPWQQGTRWCACRAAGVVAPGDPAVRVALVHVPLDVRRAACCVPGWCSISMPWASSWRVLTLAFGRDRGDGVGGDLQTVAVGGAVVADVGHDRVLEPPGPFDVGVAGAQLDQRVGLAMCQRVPRLTAGGTELLGHVLEHPLDQDPVELRDAEPSRDHPELGLTPGPQLPRLTARPCVLGRERACATRQLLQIERRQVLARVAPIPHRSAGSPSRVSGSSCSQRQLARGGRVRQRGRRLQRPRRPRPSTWPCSPRTDTSGIGSSARRRSSRTLVSASSLDLETALLAGAPRRALLPHPGGGVAAEARRPCPDRSASLLTSSGPSARGAGTRGKRSPAPYRTYVRLSSRKRQKFKGISGRRRWSRGLQIW